MTMANVKSEDGPFEVEYPEGVPYSSWNFNTYTMLTMVKKTCFGQVKTDLSYLIQHLLPGTTKKLLEKSTSLELERCFLANQKFDAERVGSMPEDVPIIQPITQPIDAEGEEIMRDVGLSFECDYNLCFKDLSASENTSQKPELAESTMTLVQLQVVPSVFSGHVELEVHESVDTTSGLQNLCVENRGRRLFSSELLIEQMYNVLTIITAILNVHRIKYHHNTNNIFREEDNISLLNYLQYVGQAGPAVHVVTCISGLSQKCRHLFLTEDVSLSVPCNEWPGCARDWVSRVRPSGWPTQELIDKVLQGGCHVVPKFETSENIPEASDKNETPNVADKKVNQDGCYPSTSSNSGITSDARRIDECHAFPKFETSEKLPEASDKNETPNVADKNVHQDGCHPSSSSNTEITSGTRRTDEWHTFHKFEASEKSQEVSDNNQLSAAENTVIKDGFDLEHTFEPSNLCSVEASSTTSITGKISGTPSHDSPPKTLWRYSFSFAEKTLMTSITEIQKMCYLIFKYLFSKYIKLHSVITTYTAKTIFLWKLETVSSDQWSLQLVGDRVKDLVEDLRTCVKQKYCQHFFISECNILHQMDDKSRDTTLEVGFSLLGAHMAEAPVLSSQTFEAPSGFPVDFMFTYKSFYSINAWLESLNAQMLAKLDAPSKLPSEQNVASLMDSDQTHPILMSEILKYLVLCEDIYGQCLPVPHSLLQHEKVKRLISFLEKSFTTPDKYEDCLRELDVELKFLHLQFNIIDQIEQFFKDNPNFAYQFESSSDEGDTQEDEPTE